MSAAKIAVVIVPDLRQTLSGRKGISNAIVRQLSDDLAACASGTDSKSKELLRVRA